MKYKLPTAFAVHVESDPVLQQLMKDGEEHNRPVSEFFKAACAYLLDSRRYLFVEIGRYLMKYGPLEPIDYDTGATPTTEPATETQEEVPNKKEYPPLKSLPPAEQNDGKRFSKKYE